MILLRLVQGNWCILRSGRVGLSWPRHWQCGPPIRPPSVCLLQWGEDSEARVLHLRGLEPINCLSSSAALAMRATMRQARHLRVWISLRPPFTWKFLGWVHTLFSHSWAHTVVSPLMHSLLSSRIDLVVSIGRSFCSLECLLSNFSFSLPLLIVKEMLNQEP